MAEVWLWMVTKTKNDIDDYGIEKHRYSDNVDSYYYLLLNNQFYTITHTPYWNSMQKKMQKSYNSKHGGLVHGITPKWEYMSKQLKYDEC